MLPSGAPWDHHYKQKVHKNIKGITVKPEILVNSGQIAQL